MDNTSSFVFSLFKQLIQTSDIYHKQAIEINELIDAYTAIMIANKLNPIPEKWLIYQLNKMVLPNNIKLVKSDSQTIEYYSYASSLKYYLYLKHHYLQMNHLVFPIIKKNRIDIEECALFIITGCFDILAVCIIIGITSGLPNWLMFARISAIIILTNLLYLLIPLTNISSMIPDHIIANGFPVNSSKLCHRVFGIKILVASITHIVGHFFQVRTAIRLCIHGCKYTDVWIVHKSKTQVMISFGYFIRQYPYLTGILLLIIFSVIGFSALLLRKFKSFELVRHSTNVMIHKYCAIIGIILIIAHGGTHLLGFNYSLILLLPVFIAYCWNLRHEIFYVKHSITRWVVTSSIIRLYLSENDRLDTVLSSYNNAGIYINYPKISKIEWHPFTLSRSYQSTDAVLTIARVGKWTNTLADKLVNSSDDVTINIGRIIPSVFRFHRLYTTKYYFCAGIGITAFVASMSDIIKNSITDINSITLIWSISDISVLNEFNELLIDFKKQIANLKIMIYYSNKRNLNSKNNTLTTKLRFDYLQALIYTYTKIDIITNKVSPICCMLQRADFNTILLNAFEYTKTSNDKTIGIFICGSSAYCHCVTNCVDYFHNNRDNISFKTWCESV